MKPAATLHDRLLAAAEAVSQHLGSESPEVAIILGSGLASAAERLQGVAAVPYAALPCFPEPTVAGHPGRLLSGAWGGRRLLVFCGRVHTYEGYPAAEIAFPVRVAAILGARTLVVTNVSGAIEPSYAVGEIVMIRDHINLTGASPLGGPNDERQGPRFVDMSEPYAPALRELASSVAKERFGSPLREGVYASMPGPSYETKAEVKMLRLLGADLVGMSTVHEVIAARHSGLAVLGLSLVANPAAGVQASPLRHEDVTAAAAAGAARLGELLETVVTRLPPAASDS
ncbi:MAG: purine-nucleoside phosphorylase [Deltaproteobacteria bacterium]|jgi:purine-nucleoside phosphorylase|nr:purine-nucleoside phosphorylase [Deltaproteobacteria bacterium]